MIRGPYPELRPFERDEAELFFGREEQVDQLLDKLDEGHFLAVLGTSGSRLCPARRQLHRIG